MVWINWVRHVQYLIQVHIVFRKTESMGSNILDVGSWLV